MQADGCQAASPAAAASGASASLVVITCSPGLDVVGRADANPS
jgi:hypothetical protein